MQNKNVPLGEYGYFLELHIMIKLSWLIDSFGCYWRTLKPANSHSLVIFSTNHLGRLFYFCGHQRVTVCIHLRELSSYIWDITMYSFSREIARSVV